MLTLHNHSSFSNEALLQLELNFDNDVSDRLTETSENQILKRFKRFKRQRFEFFSETPLYKVLD